jgi:hypothetical protein
MLTSALSSAIALVVTFAASYLFEVVYRRRTGRTFSEIIGQTEPKQAS